MKAIDKQKVLKSQNVSKINTKKLTSTTVNKKEKQDKKIIKNNLDKSKSIINSKKKDVNLKDKNEQNRTFKRDEFKKLANTNQLTNTNQLIKNKIEINYESDFESDEEDNSIKKEDQKIKDDLKDIKKASESVKSKRPETTTKIHDRKINRAKELLDMITLNTVEFEIVNIKPIDYKEYMEAFGNSGKENTKQFGIQSILKKDVEIQVENQMNLDHKSTQTPSELLKSNQNTLNSIQELFKLKKFLLKSENILNKILIKNRSQLNYNVNKFGQLFKIDYQFNQIITFHYFNDSQFKTNYALIVFWYGNQLNEILYSREKISSSLAIENGIYILGTKNGTILIYDLANKNQIKSNLNLPDLKIDGLNKDNLINCSYSTLFSNENLHKSKIVKLEYIKVDDNFNQSIRLISLDEQGFLLIWNLEKLKNSFLSLDSKMGKGMTPLSKFKLNLVESLDLNKIIIKNEIKLNKDFQYETFEKLNSDKFDYLLPINDENQNQKILYFVSKSILKNNYTANLSISISFINYNNLLLNENLFLTASLDGTINLFDLSINKPIYVWQLDGLIKISWINLNNCLCFIVLDKKNKIKIFDLNLKLDEPTQIINEDSLKIIDYVLNYSNLEELNLFIGLENGELKQIKINKPVEDDNYGLIKILKF